MRRLCVWFDPEILDTIARSPLFPVWCDVYGEDRPDQLPLGVGEGLIELAELLEASANSVQDAEGADGKAIPAGEDLVLWQATLQELELQMTKATFNAWLRDARLLRRDDAGFVIGVRNEAARAWLAHQMQGVVARTLAAVVGDTTRVQFVVLRE